VDFDIAIWWAESSRIHEHIYEDLLILDDITSESGVTNTLIAVVHFDHYAFVLGPKLHDFSN